MRKVLRYNENKNTDKVVKQIVNIGRYYKKKYNLDNINISIGYIRFKEGVFGVEFKSKNHGILFDIIQKCELTGDPSESKLIGIAQHATRTDKEPEFMIIQKQTNLN